MCLSYSIPFLTNVVDVFSPAIVFSSMKHTVSLSPGFYGAYPLSFRIFDNPSISNFNIACSFYVYQSCAFLVNGPGSDADGLGNLVDLF